MKSLSGILLIAILSGIAELFLPWWSIAVVAFAVVLLLKPGKAFWTGFAGVGIYWLIASMFRDVRNDHILSTRLAGVFHLPSYWLFLLVTAIIGGLVGGLSAWAGSLIGRR